jgi:hypothetical protein
MLSSIFMDKSLAGFVYLRRNSGNRIMDGYYAGKGGGGKKKTIQTLSGIPKLKDSIEKWTVKSCDCLSFRRLTLCCQKWRKFSLKH